MGEKQQQSKCLYEILGVSRDSSQEEIRSAYKKLALQLHPDKLVSSGISESEATAAFQSLLNAYQILSDPRERSWYDSHRSQILFSSPSTTPSSSSRLIDVDQLFPFFSNSIFSSFSDTRKGFYKVYGDIFSKIYAQELSFAKEMALDLDAIGIAPLIGNLDSPYSQVTAFYAFWMGFSTVLDFSWVDPYAANQGPSRKARRVMEDENRKARKKAKREFNEAVRGLAEFAKKRDKRVIEMQRKRKVEEEKRRAEEMERKKEESRKKAEKARLYKEPDWARIDDEEDMIADDGFDDDGDGRKKEKELYCIICNKKFKSEKQWGNHEQSKKHREKVAELRVSFKDEGEQDIEKNDENTVKFDGAAILDDHMDKTHKGSSLSEMPEENVDDLCEEFDDRLSLQGEESEIRSASDNSKDDDEGIEASFVTIGREDGGNLSGSDDELTILAAMVSGRKSRKDAMERQPETSSSGKTYEDDNEEPKSMEYDTRKGTRRFEPNTSTPSFSDNPSLMHLPPAVSHKHPAGRKKFHETRHPTFRGVRQRNGSKWVSEVREPQKKSRIWLGTFPCPEMAATAYDVAALALRGKSAQLNFPNLAQLLPRPESSLAKDIQKAATTAAHTFRAVDSFLTAETPVSNCKHRVADGKTVFIDDEALFNMPSLLANMAEGLLIPPPPPPMQNEMNYDDLDGHVDFSLWSA